MDQTTNQSPNQKTVKNEKPKSSTTNGTRVMALILVAVLILGLVATIVASSI